MRGAVGLRLCLDLCELHQCHCGFLVDARGLHSFVCKSPGQVSQRCPQRTDSSILCFSWSPSHKGAFRVVPDGRESTRWSDTRPVAERKVDVLGPQCHLSSGRIIREWCCYEAGAAAEVGASSKEAKYADLGSRYIFEPIAVETLSPPLPSNRHHRSNGDCLEGKRENYQVCSVQYCAQQLRTVHCIHI